MFSAPLGFAGRKQRRNGGSLVIEGQFGAWRAISADPLGRRVTCICACGSIRQVATEALTNGESVGCGCSATPRPKRTARPGFAATFAEAELRAATRRHQWRG
jgi:hypothetical protein